MNFQVDSVELRFTLWYIRARKNLKRVLLLIDGRSGIGVLAEGIVAKTWLTFQLAVSIGFNMS